MGKYNEGDLVMVTKGEIALQGRVADVNGNGNNFDMVLPLAHSPEDLEQAIFLEWYEHHGFDIEVIEKAKPKLELPTEHGVYAAGGIDRYNRFYVLDDSGWTYLPIVGVHRRTKDEMIRGLVNVDGTALEKLVRLVPEEEK